MALLGANSETAKGLAIGVGVALLAPVVVTSLLGASRPLARAAIKSGLILYEKGREAAAEFSEVVEDLVAEARAELAEQHPHAHAEESDQGEAQASTHPRESAVRKELSS